MWGISYWAFPVVSGCVWLGMIITMLVVWNVEGQPQYASFDPGQTIAYISDVGAEGLKPLFIAGSVVTTVFLDLSFVSERWLRHRGRLARNTSTSEKFLSVLSMVFAIIGTVGLICLSIFDTLRHPQLHDLFLLLFIAGYVISAILLCWEYQRLGIHYRQHRVLRISFWMKLVFILVEMAMAIAFSVCNFKKISNVAAVLEWAVAFIFTFYVISFAADLIPAVHTKNYSSSDTAMAMEQNDSLSNQNVDNRNNNGNVNGSNSRNTHNASANGQIEYVVNGVHYGNGNEPKVQTTNY